MPNKALHLTAIPLRSITTGELCHSPFARVSELPVLAPLFSGAIVPQASRPSLDYETPYLLEQAGETLAARKNSRCSTTRVIVTGLLGASRALLAGALSRKRRVILLVTDGPDSALDAIADLRAFEALEETLATRDAGSHYTLFPAWDVLPTESDRPEGLTLAGRRRVTERLKDIRSSIRNETPILPECFFVIAPVIALLQPVESPSETVNLFTLRVGDEHDPIMLGRKLLDAGYDRVGQAEVRGEFSLRGGILDIFPHTSETPYRLDFLGEMIESIRPFDPISQRSDDPVDSISFADASPQALQRLFSPGASNGSFSLLDHLPPDSLIICQEPQSLRQRAELYQASLVSGRSFFFELNQLLDQIKARFDTVQLVSEDLAKKNEDTTARDEGLGFAMLEATERIAIACTTLQRVEGDIATNSAAWRKLAVERQQTLVFCETIGQRQRLRTLFDEQKIPIRLPASGQKEERQTEIRLVPGRLSGGFDLREAGLAAISDREILGHSKHAPDTAPRIRHKHPPGTVAIRHLMDLQVGDYVVHVAHGIARYLGLARLEKSGRLEDYLTLLFADDVKLYVPATHIGLVGKYIGGHAQCVLSTLGTKVWARKKERAAAAVRDIAEDLLAVQAARKNLPGIVYPPDGDWQGPFEAAFPYEETADQLTAIADVKKDMQSACPMDRLICGDVGFGKTEVALRAAFKTAASGKQVAVLAPTTLLVEQHGRTFRERFAGYPLTVEVLSRFKTAREQQRILSRLATGRLDVVIGTHRLLQKDVHFKDLGLAIIDEEQRFGVEHKELFKHLRRSLDVLTLTATPIPRTLHMAMIGLRDISNLTIPPRNRRPINTKVAHVSDDLLRRAILREISRGGQVFVVHPRVRDIEDFKDYLAKLTPEARFIIGHGQMNADNLEMVMAQFLRGEVDVLVSTTIVESGLDIPTANTILIHEADHFGLAELHQLRGRVGRSDLQAYCYLLLPEHRALTSEGLRRLRALEEFDELGAGFQLALKDLEIRGAGNVLGRQQSGEIAEIGYDLYCRLLNATVKKLRGEVIEEELEVNLQLRGAAYIPETYIEDDKVVLEIYRRLDATRNDEDVDGLKAEIEERFGPLTEPAQRMFEETKLRRLARRARVPYIGIDHKEERLILKLHNWDLTHIDRALSGILEAKGARVLDNETLSFGLTLKSKHDERALRELARSLLEPLMRFRQK
ncbi:MAG: transcription-repair coupling factor [Planctomycetota bacterium]